MEETIKERIRTVLTEKIRPSLNADGGDVELIEITEDGVVRLKLTGACVGCPFSQMTVAFGVEKTLKTEIPEIKRVEAVE